MKEKSRLIFSQGSGIILSLIISSITTAFILMSISYNKINNETKRIYNDKLTVNDIVNEISTILSSQSNCTNSFLNFNSQNTPISTITKIISNGIDLYPVGSSLRSIKIIDYSISNSKILETDKAPPNGAGKTDLIIQFSRYKSQITKKISLNIEVDSNLNILKCVVSKTLASTSLDKLIFKPIPQGQLPPCNSLNKGQIVFYQGFLCFCSFDGWRFSN